MPTTIAEAFATVRLVREGIVSVRWGTKPTTSEPGVLVLMPGGDGAWAFLRRRPKTIHCP